MARSTRLLAEGDELSFRDRTLRVLHRPGHSPTDTLFWEEQQQMMIGGDHLLAHISSNPLVSRPLDGEADDGRRPHALLTYLESMEKTRALALDLVLPGHGEAITDHVPLIDERFRMHERRARKLLKLLEPAPLSAYELAVQMWGNIAVTQAFLTISEVLGHLDLLVRDGHVAEREHDGVVRFEALD